MAYIVGCKANAERVAKALNIHIDVIYEDPEHSLMILNLFQEKFIRKMLPYPSKQCDKCWVKNGRFA